MVVVNSIVFKMLVLKISEEATIERIQNRVPNTSQHTIPLKLFFNISQHLPTQTQILLGEIRDPILDSFHWYTGEFRNGKYHGQGYLHYRVGFSYFSFFPP